MPRHTPSRHVLAANDQDQNKTKAGDALEEQTGQPLRLSLSQDTAPQQLADVPSAFQNLPFPAIDLDDPDPGGQLQIAVLERHRLVPLSPCGISELLSQPVDWDGPERYR